MTPLVAISQPVDSIHYTLLLYMLLPVPLQLTPLRYSIRTQVLITITWIRTLESTPLSTRNILHYSKVQFSP